MAEPSQEPTLPEEYGTETLEERTWVDSFLAPHEQLSLQNQSLIQIVASLKQHLTATLEQRMKEIRTQLNQLNQEEPIKLQRTNGKLVTLPLELTNEKHIELSQENPQNLKRRIRNRRSKSPISTSTTERHETSSSSSKTSRNNKLFSKYIEKLIEQKMKKVKRINNSEIL
ncbi:hypothetical protein WN943_015750 [Citrus x changshan-huyou]